MSDLKKIKCTLTASVCAVLLAANSASVYAASGDVLPENGNVSETASAADETGDTTGEVSATAEADPDSEKRDDAETKTNPESTTDDIEGSANIENTEGIKTSADTENGKNGAESVNTLTEEPADPSATSKETPEVSGTPGATDKNTQSANVDDTKTDAGKDKKDAKNEDGQQSDSTSGTPAATGTNDDPTVLIQHEPYHGSVSCDGRDTELVFDGDIGNENSDTILGDSWFYGVVANDFTFNGESETNFAVKTFHHISEGTEGGQTGITDKAEGAKRGWFVAGTVDAPFMIKGIGADITTPSGEQSKFKNSTNNGGDLKFHDLSQDEINEYVTNLREDVVNQSTRLAKHDSIKNYDNLPQNKMTVDVTSAGQGTVYINVDKWDGLKTQFTQSSGVTIKKNPGQKVVLNFPESTDISTQKLVILEDDKTYDSTQLANTSEFTNVASDVIINAPNATNVTLNDTCAIILAPNAEVHCYGVDGGWVICDKMVNGCEWHFTNGSLPEKMVLGERRPKSKTTNPSTETTTSKENPSKEKETEKNPPKEEKKEEQPDKPATPEQPETKTPKSSETPKEEQPNKPATPEQPETTPSTPSETPKNDEKQPTKPEQAQPQKPEITEKTDRPETPDNTKLVKREVPVIPETPNTPALPETPLNDKPSKTIETEVPLQPDTSNPNVPFEKKDTTEVVTKDHVPGSNNTEVRPTNTADLDTPQLTSTGTSTVSNSTQTVTDSSQSAAPTVSGVTSTASDATQTGTTMVSDSSENVTSTISDSPETGDNSHLGAYAASLLGSIAAFFGVAIFDRKRKHSEN